MPCVCEVKMGKAGEGAARVRACSIKRARGTMNKEKHVALRNGHDRKKDCTKVDNQ